MHVISLEPALEQRMLEALRGTEHGPVIALDPALGQQVLMDITRFATDAENQNLRPVLTCAPQIRPALRRMIRPTFDRLPVLSYPELLGAGNVRSLGVVPAEVHAGALA